MHKCEYLPSYDVLNIENQQWKKQFCDCTLNIFLDKFVFSVVWSKKLCLVPGLVHATYKIKLNQTDEALSRARCRIGIADVNSLDAQSAEFGLSRLLFLVAKHCTGAYQGGATKHHHKYRYYIYVGIYVYGVCAVCIGQTTSLVDTQEIAPSLL